MKKASISLLAVIVAAGATGTFAAETALVELVKEKLVEVNPKTKNEQGQIAVRATEAGLKYGQAPAAEVPKPTLFALASAPIPIPAARKASGGGRDSKYPLAEMQVEQSFAVAIPEGETQEDLFKSLSSTVATARRRFSEPTGNKTTNRKGDEVDEMQQTRDFEVRRVEDLSPWGLTGQGVAVWRTK